MLDTAQTAAAILDITYQANLGQIVAPAFGATSATLNQERAMIDIESKILWAVQPSSIIKDFFWVLPQITLTLLRQHLSMLNRSLLIPRGNIPLTDMSLNSVLLHSVHGSLAAVQ